MPVSISMSVSETSVDTANNRSIVSVVVTAHYTGGSFNRNDPPLTVTLDGVSDTVGVDFNAGESTSGSETIYSKSWYVGHDSDGKKTLYYSASYVTGTGSGTVSTSGSLVLTPITVSGGDSGGDSGDDDDDTGVDSGVGSGSGSDGEDLLVHPDTNCIYLGTSRFGGSYGNAGLENHDLSSFNFFIKFKTPSDLTSSNSITVRLTNYLVSSRPYSSDNLTFYLYEGEAYNEKEPMTSVDGLPNELGIIYDSYDIVIPTTELKPDTEYSVKMISSTGNSVSVDAPVGIIIDYIATSTQCYISGVSSDDPYTINIEDGTNWYKYEAYIDTGTGWDLY